MSIVKQMEEIPIPPENGSAYDAMTFDGTYYYFLLSCKKTIVKTNMRYVTKNTYSLCREYHTICYDSKEKCFWASSKKCCNRIFKLDGKMREIDCIHICDCGETTGVITGLSYNCCKNMLLVAFPGCIVEVDKKTEQIEGKHKVHGLRINSVLSLCPGYLVSGWKENQQYIYIFDCEDHLVHEESVCKCSCIKDMIFNPCKSTCEVLVFELLVCKKECYSYVIKAITGYEEIGFIPEPCNYNICRHHEEEEDCCDFETCNEVLESIALVETALSHILNAEGEKIQKVLAVSNDLEEIMCVNREVNQTIIHATHLEQVLYGKLEKIISCCEKNRCRR
ncbi:MAG: hypothetical protein RR223_06635 [Lachnospiraceae bacterium]